LLSKNERLEIDTDQELATAPVDELVTRYSSAMMKGTIVEAVAVVLEGFVMGMGFGSHGLACVGILMSFEYLNLAFGNLFGTGVLSVAGNLLGAGEKERASHAFSQGFWLSVFVSLTLMALIEAFAPQLATLFGATPDILEDSVVCIRAFGILFPMSIVGQMLVSVMRIEGKTSQSAAVMIFASIMSLAWFTLSTFVFGFGIVGAGVYYGLSIGLYAIGIFWFIGGRSELRIRFADMRPDWRLCLRIMQVGLPTFLVQLGTFFYNAVTDNLLRVFGGQSASLYIAAFSVVSGYVVYIAMKVALAFTNGMQPIAAFSNGMRSWRRLGETLRSSLRLEMTAVATVSVACFVFAEPICAFFTSTDGAALTAATVHATRFAVVAATLGFTSMMMSTYFQSSGIISLSTVLGLLRYVILSCPLMYGLGLLFGVEGVWWGMAIADVLTGVVCLTIARAEQRRLAKLDGNDESHSASIPSALSRGAAVTRPECS
jgi:Na+-driven multidrug efflux pump